MGVSVKRRSLIRQTILRFKSLGGGDYLVGFKHREPGVGERIAYISMSRIVNIGKWALELDNGSSIPYHRVIEIRSSNGVIVWRR